MRAHGKNIDMVPEEKDTELHIDEYMDLRETARTRATIIQQILDV